jgi:Zn-dependent peptidase ImmA (M78 family)
MKTNKRKIIEQKVSELLRKSGITKAPIDVEIIASNLNINVRRTPTEDDISGFLLRQPDGQTLIGVNTLHHPNRQRFTIAHEIGHFALHNYDTVHVDRSIVKLRSKVSSSGEDQEEVEANRFAAELLMPGELLAKDLETLLLTDFLDERRMQQLAKRYAVSVQAMTNRLISLGYLHPDELGIS